MISGISLCTREGQVTVDCCFCFDGGNSVLLIYAGLDLKFQLSISVCDI